MNTNKILLGVVIAIAVVAAFYFGSNMADTEPQPTVSPTVSPSATVSPSPTGVQGACKPTGCSGQICADTDVVTTCEFRQEYECYKTAKCERQTNGDCGWTQTPALTTCLTR